MPGFEEISTFANDHTGLIALIGVAIAMIAFFWAIVCGIFKFVSAPSHWQKRETHFADPLNYPALLDCYNCRAIESYFTAIRRILYITNRTYGRHTMSWQSFNTCLMVALAYPLIAAFLAWLTANVANPGGLVFFRDTPQAIERANRGLLALIGLSTAVFLLLNAEKFGEYGKSKASRWFSSGSFNHSLISKFAKYALEIGAFSIAMALAIAGGLAVSLSVAFSIIFAVAIASSLAFKGVLDLKYCLLGAIAFVGFLIFALAIAGEFTASAVIFLVFIILPLLNVIADYVSISATRWFLRRVTKRQASIWEILLGLFIDLGVAIVCLLFLLFSIRQVLELWTTVSPNTVPLNWELYVAELNANHWNGIALYFMVFTTMIPTAIHVAAGIGALITQKSRALHKVVQKLEQAILLDETFSPVQSELLTYEVRKATFWGYFTASLLVALMSSLAMVVIF